VTGGGAELNNITQLFEYITGMDSRIGYPNEHLGKASTEEAITSPMYATGVGLVLKGFETNERNRRSLAAVKSHSKRTKGSFFDKLLEKGKSWFEEDVE
jgi:cell division protein FtsA